MSLGLRPRHWIAGAAVVALAVTAPRAASAQVGGDIDLNLFRGGKMLTTTEDHRPLGEWWESHGGAWGGRFADGNHYSLEHEGLK